MKETHKQQSKANQKINKSKSKDRFFYVCVEI